MSTSAQHRGSGSPPPAGKKLHYSLVKAAVAQSNLATVAQYMFWLMFGNVASDGFVFEDPVNAGVLSRPGAALME